MIANIRPFYYFKYMDAVIAEFCNQCDICKKNKSRRSRDIGRLSQLGPAKEPYEIMSLDTIAGNHSPKRYLHLLVDHFSRFAYTCPSKGQQAKDLIRFLRPIFEKNKVNVLLADRYAAINSNEFKSFIRNCGITLIFTAVDCPFSNGLNERLNQTLVNRIRCKVNEKPRHPWSNIAIECTEEYNRTTHSVTKFSPLYLLMGEQSSILPSDLNQPQDLAQNRTLAFQNSQRAHNNNKIRVDQKKQDYEFKVGDLVYVEMGNRLNRNKLDPIRKGPFKILNRFSSSIYEINGGYRRN
ncbi:retrovirus-related Pol polyprotein from transposon gypsy isoform X2 [Diabrotica virgifera virgifera]|uniref:Integrase catalytic domain-containing protein n=1 Tax=Diabrotica virgifera virgifera TaxID=50390 RepID=A0ABM5KYF7_DIAVI|nr:retrovirus-related Pol polyprotein from transposon gypsy isoform X2 [Diabrotica virgifera virgifera]